MQINRGFRVEFNSALGPYKGGLRFHPSVNLGIVKFLGFEQIFKNALTGLPIGGGKGGSDFDPKGRSDAEIMRFCQSFMTELLPPPRRVHRRPGRRHRRRRARDRLPVRPVQADHQPLRVRRAHRQGPGLRRLAGAHARPPATAPSSSPSEMLRARRGRVAGKRVVSSPARATSRSTPSRRRSSSARTVVACSDSNGYVVDEDGIDLDAAEPGQGGRPPARLGLRRAQRAARARSSTAAASGTSRATSRCPARPRTSSTATARERADRQRRAARSPRARTCPPPPTPCALFQEAGVLFAPGKAANAGGVATSALEMQQNASRDSWTFEYTEERLARDHGRRSTTAAPRPPRSTASRATTSPAPTSRASCASPTRCSPSASSDPYAPATTMGRPHRRVGEGGPSRA